MLVAKLKWMGSGRNLYRLSKLEFVTMGTYKMSVYSLVAGVYRCNTLIWNRSEVNLTKGTRFFFAAA